MVECDLRIRSLTVDDMIKQPDTVVSAVSRLLTQLSGRPRSVNPNWLREVANQDGVNVFLGFLDNDIVATFTAAIYAVPTKRVMIIEDVVVDEVHRGKGFGNLLTRFAIDFAGKHKVDMIDLTSRPSRHTAVQMYLRNGFVKRDTNFFRYTVPP